MRRVALLLGFTLAGCAHAGPRHPAAPPKPNPDITLTANGQPSTMCGFPPCNVYFRAKLREDADLTGLSCVAIEWQFGRDEGASLKQAFMNCEGVALTYVMPHIYHTFGDFQPTIYLRSPITGNVIVWGSARVMVGPPPDRE